MSELKPCPFCGNEATETVRRGKHGLFGYITCTYCNVETRKKAVKGDFDDPLIFEQYAFDELRAIWNKRCNDG